MLACIYDKAEAQLGFFAELNFYAEWTLLSQVFGQVYFKQNGCLVSFYYSHVL